MSTIFIDGAAGTVGLALAPHLDNMQQEGLFTRLIRLPEADRHNISARKDAAAEADLVVLCLPDQAAAVAAKQATDVNPKVRILDASAAHRCEPNWVYGLPEITAPASIAAAARVANPGCFATACILAAQPLARPLNLNRMAFQGVTGYSAGGRRAIEHAQDFPRLVQFGKPHRHLPEIACYGGVIPSLTTMVGSWEQGMLVQAVVNLPYKAVWETYRKAYENTAVQVRTAREMAYRVDPQACNGTDAVLIVVAEQPSGETAVAVVLDNLGKGSAGAAAANLRLMLRGA